MIVSIAQPAYWMWAGLVERIDRSDLHVVLDNVPHSHGSFTNRNGIRTREGRQWLTVPILSRGDAAQKPIAELRIGSGDWRHKHLRSLEHAYARAPFFADYRTGLGALFARDYGTIAEVCAATTRFTLDAFGVATKLVRASDVGATKRKSELVLEICEAVGARTYLSGPFGRDYLDRDAFRAAGITIVFNDFHSPDYPQAQPGPFEPNLAAIDLLFNCGPGARDVLGLGSRVADRV
jgi:hypothetical protein